MKSRKHYLPELPQEIWGSIFLLAKVPVKSLGKLRYACKSWNDLIGSPSFVGAHDQSEVGKSDLLLVKSKNAGGLWLFCPGTNRKVLDLELPRQELPFRFSIIGSCKGLLCISIKYLGLNGRSISIWNPSIGKLKRLPEGLIQSDDRESATVGFGFGEKDYKLVRIEPIDSDFRLTYGVEVYSLCLDSWRRITTVHPLNGSDSVHFQEHFGTYFQGAVYWICWMGDYSNKYLLSFSVGSETIEIRELGVLTLKLLQTSSIGVSIGVFKNSLSLFHKREEGGFIFCEIWVRREHKWEFIQHLMHPTSFEVAWPLSGTTDHRFHIVLETLDCPDQHHFVLYDLISRNFDVSGIEQYGSGDNYIDEYRESLILLE